MSGIVVMVLAFGSINAAFALLIGQHFHAHPGNRENGPVLHRYDIARTHDSEPINLAQYWIGDDRYDWTPLDNFINYHWANGAKTLLTVFGSPNWASSQPAQPGQYGPGSNAPPKNLASWGRMIEAAVRRYPGKIAAVECWNEPFGNTEAHKEFFSGTATELADMCRELYQAVKRADSKMPVISPSQAYGPGMNILLDAKTSLGEPMHWFFDWLGFHPYDFADWPDQYLANQIDNEPAAYLAARGLSKPLIVTEWGFYGRQAQYCAMPDAAKADLLRRTLSLAQTKGLVGFVLYAYDNGTSPCGYIGTKNPGPGWTYNATVSGAIDAAWVEVGARNTSPPPTPPPPRAPTADIKAGGSDGPITVGYGASTVISWTSTSASSCTVSPSSGAGLSGSISSGALSTKTSYTLSCSGPGGTATDSVVVNVSPAPTPTVDIKAGGSSGSISISSGSSTLVSWTSSNVTACAVTPGGWTGTANSGVSTGALASSTTFSISCSGPGGSVGNAVTVNVTPAPPPTPTLSLSASAASVVQGQSVTITWNSTNATSCTASGAWSGAKSASGTASVIPAATATYSMQCIGAGGTVTQTQNVLVKSSAGNTVVASGYTQSGLSVATGGIARYQISVPSGAKNLTVTTTGGAGNVDLYLRFGNFPSIFAYDQRSIASGNTDSIVVATPRVGTHFLMVYGNRAASGVTLTIRYSQ